MRIYSSSPFCRIGYNAGCLFANGKGLNGQIGRACLWSCLPPLRPYSLSQYGKLPNSFVFFVQFVLIWTAKIVDCCSRRCLPGRGKVDLHSLRNIQIPFHKSIKPIPSLSLSLCINLSIRVCVWPRGYRESGKQIQIEMELKYYKCKEQLHQPSSSFSSHTISIVLVINF